MPLQNALVVLVLASLAVQNVTGFLLESRMPCLQAKSLNVNQARCSRRPLLWRMMAAEEPSRACDVVSAMYASFNRRDLEALMSYMNEECVYQNTNFASPFSGKERVRYLMSESFEKLPDDLRYCIDDMTEGDDLRVGVLWHLTVGDKPFPQSDGCSFYRLEPESRKIVFARTIVEPVFKPEFNLLPILGTMASLVRNDIYKGFS